MMKKPRIALLFNNRMAFPAINSLLESGHLVAAATPSFNAETMPYLEYLAANTAVATARLEAATLDAQLSGLLKQANADAVFIMTFPWLVPSGILAQMETRVYNFHYGLLPEMKGADPVFESIRQQKKETGITVHIATSKIDGGPIVLQSKIPVDARSTHGLLCTGLGFLGANMAKELCQMLESGKTVTAIPQQTGGAYFPRPQWQDVKIDWQMMDSTGIQALARACNPWNKGAVASHSNWPFKIVSFSSHPFRFSETAVPGTLYFNDQEETVMVCCRDKSSLKIEIINTEEGVFTGYQLRNFGMASGAILY